MKALTLWQPWASAVAVGAKRIETRAWSTEYRGPLAIHAAKTKRGVMELAERSVPLPPHHLNSFRRQAERVWRAALAPAFGSPEAHQLLTLPLGAVVAVAHLVDVVPTDDRRVQDLSRSIRMHFADLGAGDWCEKELGDFGAGRYAWLLDNVQRLVPHIPAVGRQGLWSWPAPGAVTELHARRRGVLS